MPRRNKQTEPYLKAIDLAVEANHKQEQMFKELGGKDNPGGSVTSTYRTANLALTTALALDSVDARRQAAGEIVSVLRYSVVNTAGLRFEESFAYGIGEADKQLEAYRLKQPGATTQHMREVEERIIVGALDDIRSRIEQQAQSLNAMMLLGAEEEQITGGQDRVGILRDSAIIPAMTFYMASLIWTSFELQALRSQSIAERTYQKQAIAVLDRRTTECCLKVHGQIQRFTSDFTTLGSPAYADRQDWPPFHPRCRTSIALYNSTFDWGISSEMTGDAAWILSERDAGRDPDQAPANAFFPH
jgi:hypothetical protein